MFFKQRLIKQGRKTNTVGTTTNWGSTSYSFVREFYETIQPFTGDDHLVDDQRAQNVRDLITVAGPNFDVKFEDIFIYDNTVHSVVYIQPFDTGVLPHVEIYTGDCADPLPDWA